MGHHQPSETIMSCNNPRIMLQNYHLLLSHAMGNGPLSHSCHKRSERPPRPTLYRDVANLHGCDTSKTAWLKGNSTLQRFKGVCSVMNYPQIAFFFAFCLFTPLLAMIYQSLKMVDHSGRFFVEESASGITCESVDWGTEIASDSIPQCAFLPPKWVSNTQPRATEPYIECRGIGFSNSKLSLTCQTQVH